MAKEAGGRKEVVDLLNEARTRELQAIMQYMAHHYELEDQDLGKLGKVMKKTAIEEMKHAETLAERILFLGGTPSSKIAGEIKRGQAIPEMLLTDKGLEQGAMDMYNHHAARCAELGDMVSKEIFEDLLGQEEVHWDAFDVIEDHVKTMGASYLATLTGEAE
jgi:bacterioferritin